MHYDWKNISETRIKIVLPFIENALTIFPAEIQIREMSKYRVCSTRCIFEIAGYYCYQNVFKKNIVYVFHFPNDSKIEQTQWINLKETLFLPKPFFYRYILWSILATSPNCWIVSGFLRNPYNPIKARERIVLEQYDNYFWLKNSREKYAKERMILMVHGFRKESFFRTWTIFKWNFPYIPGRGFKVTILGTTQ